MVVRGRSNEPQSRRLAMSSRILLFAMILAAATVAFGETRFSGEKGARGHRARLAAGFQHSCAILDDGSIRCWGDNHSGQLGDGTNFSRSSPVKVVNLVSTIS